jgi:hypothetical protein
MNVSQLQDVCKDRRPIMSNAICSWFQWPFLGVTLLAAAVCVRPVQGQRPPSILVGGVYISGIPEDWVDRYVVFSDPGTGVEALQSGRYEQWQRIVNEPRYVLHQLKRNARVRGPATADVEFRSQWISQDTVPPTPLDAQEKTPEIKIDWSQGLGTGAPGLAAGHYPAKYSLFSTTAACSDYAVFPTGSLLPHFRFIKLEACDFELYRGCSQISELSTFLAARGFRERSRRICCKC